MGEARRRKLLGFAPRSSDVPHSRAAREAEAERLRDSAARFQENRAEFEKGMFAARVRHALSPEQTKARILKETQLREALEA